MKQIVKHKLSLLAVLVNTCGRSTILDNLIDMNSDIS